MNGAPVATTTQSIKEWYVGPTGSDSAAGTSTQPFRTIGRAVAAVGPGERILVSAGTYAERVRITGTAPRRPAARRHFAVHRFL